MGILVLRYKGTKKSKRGNQCEWEKEEDSAGNFGQMGFHIPFCLKASCLSMHVFFNLFIQSAPGSATIIQVR
ncbi:uncharacterized protein EAE97_004887 [Botrytis byssoidea]|uniref:Uncharacterized protein n=1 Tax=Botrytis byssoidea TaxID=139641 RepID=A0A9P5ILF1_9HELO|nr:uncharacterized protein EAE97_004887 [Botrytis byssoidea]KAF7945849.1 hypothetical protein EAE97_004887 [Botrytis byssoidea]